MSRLLFDLPCHTAWITSITRGLGAYAFGLLFFEGLQIAKRHKMGELLRLRYVDVNRGPAGDRRNVLFRSTLVSTLFPLGV